MNTSTSKHKRRCLAWVAAAALALAGCNGGGSDATTTGTDTDTNTGTNTGTDTSTVTIGGWTLSTGANPADTDDSLAFERVTLALDTLTLASGSTRLVASGGSVTRDGSTVLSVATDANGVTITASMPSGTRPEIALTGSYGKTVTVYSNGDFRLSLEGVTINSTDGPAINVQSKQRAFVVLGAGSNNVLTDTSTYSARTLADGTGMDLKATLFSEGPLIIGGSGSLQVTAASKHALASDAHVRLRQGTVELQARKKDGLRANHAVVVDGGSLVVTTPAGKGIKVEGKEDSSTPLGFIAINGGSVDIASYDKAITASWESDEDGTTTTLADDPDPRVTINGGTINIVTTGTPYEDTNTADGDSSLSPEGIEAKSVLTINGGIITVNSTDDALNAGTAIVINGGRVYARASANDAIDSNGTLTITGGVVVADGAGNAEGGLDCDQNLFTITGGTFIGYGGRNSTPTRSATTQNTLVLRSPAALVLTLRDAGGQAVFSATLAKSATSVVLGAPGIASNTAYTLVGGGTLASQQEDFHGLVLGPGTHSGGTALGTVTFTGTVMQL